MPQPQHRATARGPFTPRVDSRQCHLTRPAHAAVRKRFGGGSIQPNAYLSTTRGRIANVSPDFWCRTKSSLPRRVIRHRP